MKKLSESKLSEAAQKVILMRVLERILDEK